MNWGDSRLRAGCSVLAAVAMAEARAGGLAQDSVVDPEGLNFKQGTFGTCINGQTFQIGALVTFQGWQYTTYFDGQARLCAARRKLPAEPWQRFAFGDYRIAHTDVHNVPVIGVSPADGTLHLAFDHHCDPLHYRVSRAGVATSPETVVWTAALFGPTVSELVPGRTLTGLTYPGFFNAPDGALQFCYRLGSSGNGDSHLATYSPTGWTLLGRFIDRAGDFQGSAMRNAYHNGFDYGSDGRLHTTWVWREGLDNGKWGLLNCHGLQYAWSDDQGRTWHNNEGLAIGTAGAEPMHMLSTGLTVRDLPYHWGVMNQVTQTVDPQGRVHAVMWMQPPDAPAASRDKNTWRYLHYWRDEAGAWHERQLPCFGRKPSVVATRNGDLVLVFTKPANTEYHEFDPGGPLHVYTATAANEWSDWHEVYRSATSFVGEPRLDVARWRQDAVLSIYAQETPGEAGTPSPLHVFEIDPTPTPNP